MNATETMFRDCCPTHRQLIETQTIDCPDCCEIVSVDDLKDRARCSSCGVAFNVSDCLDHSPAEVSAERLRQRSGIQHALETGALKDSDVIGRG